MGSICQILATRWVTTEGVVLIYWVHRHDNIPNILEITGGTGRFEGATCTIFSFWRSRFQTGPINFSLQRNRVLPDSEGAVSWVPSIKPRLLGSRRLPRIAA